MLAGRPEAVPYEDNVMYKMLHGTSKIKAVRSRGKIALPHTKIKAVRSRGKIAQPHTNIKAVRQPRKNSAAAYK